jgi:hypothetical protein
VNWLPEKLEDINVHASSTPPCQVSENYAETPNENSFTLVKLLTMINSKHSPLDNSDLFGSYYMMLFSTRIYHEDIEHELPACARLLNQAYIQAITATQDVLALKLAGQAFPEHGRYEQRLQRAKDNLNEKWLSLSQISRETKLITLDP